jgi:hypothetical protein
MKRYSGFVPPTRRNKRIRISSHYTARHDTTTRQKPACIHIFRQLRDRQNILFSQGRLRLYIMTRHDTTRPNIRLWFSHA